MATQELIERLRASGAQVEVDKQTTVAVAKLVSTFVFPLLLLAKLFGLIFVTRSGDAVSAATMGEFDSEVRRLIAQAQETATDILVADGLT